MSDADLGPEFDPAVNPAGRPAGRAANNPGDCPNDSPDAPDAPDAPAPPDDSPGDSPDCYPDGCDDGFYREERLAGEEDEHERQEMPLCGDDRAAMLELAAAFTVLPRGWTRGEDVEQWPGVYMDVVDGEKRVTALEITGGSGPLAASLGRLEYLGALELAGFDLRGVFPSGLGGLRELRELTVENAPGMAPCLPDSIDDLINLESLKIVNCPLRTLPESAGRMHQLESIVLRSCPIDKLPEALASLPQLGWLVLSGCGLEAVPDFVTRLTGLQTLDLSNNRIGGTFPEFLLDFPLVSLNLSGNRFEGEIPESLCKLSDLTMIDLSGNNFSGDAPACLAKIPVCVTHNGRMRYDPGSDLPSGRANLDGRNGSAGGGGD